jgi:hypothetical protein
MSRESSPDQEKYRLYSRYAATRPYKDMGALKPRHTMRNVLILVAVLAAAFFCWEGRLQIRTTLQRGWESAGKLIRQVDHNAAGPHMGETGGIGAESGMMVGAETESEPATVPETEVPFSPHAVESTKPSNFIASTGIEVNGTVLDDPAAYVSDTDIQFGMPQDYTDVDGIVTFRGNNFRDNPTYGHADIRDASIEGVWTQQTGALTVGSATWTGSGWTGQPLLRRWSRSQKKSMAMYDWAKEKDDLVEVIYACMDGYVYFLDMETGEKTRDPLYLGWTFKGAGALDPRGYPILYVGAGYDSNEGTAHAFIVNLVDMSTMYEFGAIDEFSLRGNLSYFDSSPLVDAETDTLIWPGENGILYLFHLNTVYDQTTGQISINPDKVVKWHYTGTRTSVQQYWLGMEDSCDIYKGYLFVADNGGNLMCMDLHTLHDGSLSTGHGNSPQDMLSRLETMVLMGLSIPIPAIRRQIASGIDIMVHLSRMRDKSRKVLEILEIDGYDIPSGEIRTHPLFEFEESGVDKDGRLTGRLKKVGCLSHTQKLRRAGISAEDM